MYVNCGRWTMRRVVILWSLWREGKGNFARFTCGKILTSFFSSKRFPLFFDGTRAWYTLDDDFLLRNNGGRTMAVITAIRDTFQRVPWVVSCIIMLIRSIVEGRDGDRVKDLRLNKTIVDNRWIMVGMDRDCQLRWIEETGYICQSVLDLVN